MLAMLFFFSRTRTRGSFEAGIAQLGGHGAFIEPETAKIAHGDTPKEIGKSLAVLRRHRHPSVDWGRATANPHVAKASRVSGPQYAVRHLPSRSNALPTS